MLRKIGMYLPIMMIAILAFGPMAHAEGMKVAVVDIEKVLNESKAGKSIQKQLTSRREAFQKEFTARENNLMNAQKTLQEQKKSMSAEEFQAKRQEFEKQILETRNLFQKRRNALDKGLGAAFGKLRKSIIEVAAAISDEDGYNIVLTRDSVVIVEKEIEITDKVLAQLNKKVSDIKLDVAE